MLNDSIRRAVTQRAGQRCEYCGLPQGFASHRFEPDHVIALQHGGSSDLSNLALACLPCNRNKGPNIASLDSETGIVTGLFHPRQQAWTEHFRWEGATIVPLTAAGRSTERVLKLNAPRRLAQRDALLAAGVDFRY